MAKLAATQSQELKGKVVVIDFWTYSCINCLRSIPYVEAWSEKYKNDGLVVIGVHTPEFAFEKDPANVAKSLTDLKITYPVAIDSNYAIWKAFNNEYWPAHYFIDANGTIRYHHFGEGKYAESEEVIQQLLREKNSGLKTEGFVQVNGAGAQAAPDSKDVASPETYIGYARQQNYVSPQKIRQDGSQAYTHFDAEETRQPSRRQSPPAFQSRAMPASSGNFLIAFSKVRGAQAPTFRRKTAGIRSGSHGRRRDQGHLGRGHFLSKGTNT